MNIKRQLKNDYIDKIRKYFIKYMDNNKCYCDICGCEDNLTVHHDTMLSDIFVMAKEELGISDKVHYTSNKHILTQQECRNLRDVCLRIQREEIKFRILCEDCHTDLHREKDFNYNSHKGKTFKEWMNNVDK